MTTDRLSESEMTQDSLASYDAALAEMRTTDHRTQPVAPVSATRCIVTDDGAITLTFYNDAEALAVITLGPADAVRLASDLLLPARRHLGRP